MSDQDTAQASPARSLKRLWSLAGPLGVGIATTIAAAVLFSQLAIERKTLLLGGDLEKDMLTQRFVTEARRAHLEASLANAARERAVAKRLAQLEEGLQELQVLARSNVPDENAQVITKELSFARDNLTRIQSQVAVADSRLAILEKRSSSLESIIIADPEKAVSLPLLRRDFDSLKQQAARDVEALRAENTRVYDLMKWIVGLMGLVSLSLIGTAAGNIFKREPPKP